MISGDRCIKLGLKIVKWFIAVFNKRYYGSKVLERICKNRQHISSVDFTSNAQCIIIGFSHLIGKIFSSIGCTPIQNTFRDNILNCAVNQQKWDRPSTNKPDCSRKCNLPPQKYVKMSRNRYSWLIYNYFLVCRKSALSNGWIDFNKNSSCSTTLSNYQLQDWS